MEIEEESVIEVNKTLALAAVKSVKSLDCPLCNDRFQHPRMLTCLHTFCSSCIQKRVSVNINFNLYNFNSSNLVLVIDRSRNPKNFGFGFGFGL